MTLLTIAMMSTAFLLGFMVCLTLLSRYVRKVIMVETDKQLNEDDFNDAHVSGRLEVVGELLGFFKKFH